MEPFKPRVTARDAAPDPSKHVKYTVGMVLGADDFTQEFAYLSGRDRWLARDLIGYGTAWGLKVGYEVEGQKGPRVVVEPGVAVAPSGQLIRVAPAQCAQLNAWLASNRAEAESRFVTSSSPPGTALTLYVVLCYRECPTDMVPIPGEPCRDENELMAPSRLADDFRLELRFDPPEQTEEDAVRDFVEWLKGIEVVEAGGSTLEDFLAAVREASHLWKSPPDSPPTDYMYGSPPAGVTIPASRVCQYLRAAFRVWTTELRPRWRPEWFDSHPCCEEHTQDKEKKKPEECVLLAELRVPLVHDAINDVWKVSDTADVQINEERRPYLLSLRMIQEWLLCGGGAAGMTPAAEGGAGGGAGSGGAGGGGAGGGGAGGGAGGAATGSPIVAAGRFDVEGRVPRGEGFTFGDLRVVRSSTNRLLYSLHGSWFNPNIRNFKYVVKGAGVATLQRGATNPGTFFEVIQLSEEEYAREFAREIGASPPTLPARNPGMVVRIFHVNLSELREPLDAGFMVEISRYNVRTL